MKTLKKLNVVLGLIVISGLALILYFPHMQEKLLKQFKEVLNIEIPLVPPKNIVRYSDNLPLAEALVEDKINTFRVQNGESELGRWEPLCDLAKIRAEEIKVDFSHAGFEERTINFGEESEYEEFCDRENIKCTAAGENLAKGYFDVEELIDGWANSEGHRKNMLSDYNAQCVAVAGGYIVSLFAFTQDTTNIQPIVVNQDRLVNYDYERVLFWEKVKNDYQGYKSSWENAYDNEFYEINELGILVDYFDECIESATFLWDGYTNSKITYAEVDVAEEVFKEFQDKIEPQIAKINKSAYENCRDYFDDLEEEHDTDLSEEKEQCEQFNE